jgi:hypothetical protein
MSPVAFVPRAVVFAAALASVAASSLAPADEGTPTTPTTTSTTEPPRKGRRTADEPTEIEVLNFVDEHERDPQAYAVGLSVGIGGISTKGSARVVPAAAFAFTFDFGLGPGGARVPWSLEPFAAFAITPASFDSDVRKYPDRFTELGTRLVYRGSGALEGRFLSLGLGLVWTSFGDCPRPQPERCDLHGNLVPAFLVDLGVGVVEWQVRGARYGFGVAGPIELSKYPGGGVFGFFYGQLGLGR